MSRKRDTEWSWVPPGRRWTFTTLLLLLLAVLTACSSREEAPSPTPTAEETATPSAPTATSTPTPTATPTATPTPTPVPAPPEPPPIPVAGTRQAEAVLIVTVPAGGVRSWDGFVLSRAAGYDAEPPCAAFAVGLSWQILEPYPPDGARVEWRQFRQGNEVAAGAGASGVVAARGCGVYEVSNPGDVDVRVAIRIAADTLP